MSSFTYDWRGINIVVSVDPSHFSPEINSKVRVEAVTKCGTYRQFMKSFVVANTELDNELKRLEEQYGN